MQHNKIIVQIHILYKYIYITTTHISHVFQIYHINIKIATQFYMININIKYK